MSIRKCTLCIIVVTLLTSDASAQQLDPKQIELIRDTATAICDTVKETKGENNTVELEGEVEARLRGLAGKLVGVGGSVEAKTKIEQFEGLTQEATAVALEGDRGCRERVFNRMLEKIGDAPDPRSLYEKDGRRADLRAVQEYLKYAPLSVTRIKDEHVCSGSDSTYGTQELRFEGRQLLVRNWGESNGERCKTGFQPKREETTSCTAEIEMLDEVIQVWSGPIVKIACLTGNCLRCTEASRFKNKIQDWKEETRSYEIDNLNVYVGGNSYVRRDEPQFYAFVRALARLLSGGSDSAFCEASPQYCEKASSGA